MIPNSNINLKTYFIDFFISFFLTLLGCTIMYFLEGVYFYILLLPTAIAAYRAGAFVHEIAHLGKRKKFHIFKIVWNLTMGVFMLYPSNKFEEPHLTHHKTGIFGTKNDPQYPLIKKDLKLAFGLFVLLPIMTPIINAVTVLLASLTRVFDWCDPIYQKAINIIYNNRNIEPSDCEVAQGLSLLLFIALGNPKLWFTWYLISITSWFLSSLRVPLEHSLKEYKEESTFEDQMTDSYTFESNPLLAFILQPVGLRYHTAHHMYPSIPYHNLKKLHEKLKMSEGKKYLASVI